MMNDSYKIAPHGTPDCQPPAGWKYEYYKRRYPGDKMIVVYYDKGREEYPVGFPACECGGTRYFHRFFPKDADYFLEETASGGYVKVSL